MSFHLKITPPHSLSTDWSVTLLAALVTNAKSSSSMKSIHFQHPVQSTNRGLLLTCGPQLISPGWNSSFPNACVSSHFKAKNHSIITPRASLTSALWKITSTACCLTSKTSTMPSFNYFNLHSPAITTRNIYIFTVSVNVLVISTTAVTATAMESTNYKSPGD